KILDFYARLNLGHRIRFKSVSLLGVTEVTFSDDARQDLADLPAEEENLKRALKELENFDFTRPFEESVFHGRIRILYRPLVAFKPAAP
ncbi:hypothetical protein P6P35_15985, partial [Clostridium perfringens]|nr:hypothetical protein [Clostridium perfringens]